MDERKSFRRCHVTSPLLFLCPLRAKGRRRRRPFHFFSEGGLRFLLLASEKKEKKKKKISAQDPQVGLPRNLQQATTSPPPCPPSPTLWHVFFFFFFFLFLLQGKITIETSTIQRRLEACHSRSQRKRETPPITLHLIGRSASRSVLFFLFFNMKFKKEKKRNFFSMGRRNDGIIIPGAVCV